MSNDPITQYIQDNSPKNNNTLDLGSDPISQHIMKNYSSNENKSKVNMQDKSLLGRAANFVTPFNNFIREKTRLPEASAGLLQNTINTGSSILNAPLEAINAISGTNYKLPYVDYSKNVQQDPLSQAIFKGSDLASNIGSGIGAYKIGNKIMGIGDKSPIYQKMAQGFGSGYAVGGNSGDNENSYNIPTSRVLSGIIGAGTAGASQLSNESLMKKIVANKIDATNKSSLDYENFIRKVENYQPDGFKIKNFVKTDNPYNKSLLSNLFSKDERRAIEDFYKNPTFRNAHLTQSEIASKIRDVSSDIAKGSITKTSGNKKIEKLNDLRSEIKLGMSNFLGSKDKNLINEYNNLGINYRKNVVPYNNKYINSYISGEHYPEKVIRQLTKDRKFMDSAGNNISGLGTRKLINNTIYSPFVKYGVLPYVGIHEVDSLIGNK